MFSSFYRKLSEYSAPVLCMALIVPGLQKKMSFPLLQSSGQHLTLRHKMASLNARGKLNHPSSLAAVDGEVSRNEC